jgi:hypothetical protein
MRSLGETEIESKVILDMDLRRFYTSIRSVLQSRKPRFMASLREQTSLVAKSAVGRWR